MAASSRRHPLFLLFLLLMLLMLAGGVALTVYGAMHNGVPAPKLPGIAPKLARLLHG